MPPEGRPEGDIELERSDSREQELRDIEQNDCHGNSEQTEGKERNHSCENSEGIGSEPRLNIELNHSYHEGIESEPRLNID